MGALIRAYDWSRHPLGPPEGWPQSLRTTLRLLLNTGHPMFIWWGPELYCFYNDAYRQSIGPERHPGSLGQPGREVWHEVWPVVGPQIEQVMSGGGPTWHVNELIPITRHGRREEVYWTYSYGPIDDDTAPNGVGGVLVVCTETTETVLAEKRRADEAARQRQVFEQAPGFIIIMNGPDHVVTFVNNAHRAVFNSHDWIGKTIRDAFPSIRGQGFFEGLDKVYTSGETVSFEAQEVRFRRSPQHAEETHLFTFVYAPLFDADGRVDGIYCEGFDVTETSAAREALRVSESRLRLATEAAQVGTWDYDPRSGELSWDERCKALFGLPPDADVTYEGSFLAGLHPEDRERVQATVLASLDPAGAGGYDTEYRTIGLTDGVERWVAATGQTKFEKGAAVRFIGTVRDISDKKRAERRFEVLNRTASLVAADLDIGRIVQSITDAGVELTGAQFGAFFYNVQDDKGEWYTLYALSGVPREAFSRFPMPRNTAIFAPTFSGEGVVRSDDIRADPRYGLSEPYRGMPEGHLPVCSYLAVPVVSRSSEVIGGLFFGHAEPGKFLLEHEEILLGVAGQAATAIDNARLFQAAQRELQHRRQAEIALKASEARLAFLDLLGQETAAAEDANSILAITTRMLGEHLGVDICAYADMEPDQDRFTIRGDWSRRGVQSIVGVYSLATFGTLAVEELHAGRPLIINDNIQEIGEEQSAMFLQIGIRSTICMPFVKQGVLTALMAVHCAHPHNWTPEELALVSEVTERSWAHIQRVRSAAQLRELNATLEQRVAHEVRERSQTEALLHQAQKMEAIGQLTGGIAHDFNNMLSVVVGGLQLTKRRLAQGNTDVAAFIEGAMDGAHRAAALTQRLLAFSRRQPLAPEVVEANKLVAAMTDLLTRTLGEAIQVETVLLSGLWRTFADPVQLESAILNLCVNARDAMPAGGRLTIETANAYIDDTAALVAGVPAGQYVMVAVTDTGEGMTPEVMAKAFDPFFTTKEVGKGSGLGLSQVFGFVQQSGGHVKLYSEVARGTAVKIYLPRYHGEATPPVVAERAKPAPASPTGETVLVVEDDERVRIFSSQALKELGYRVLAAANGKEALRMLMAEPGIALLFTDIVMPEMTGRELADAALKHRPDLKVLFTTGYTRNAIVHNGVLDPGISFLQKPFGIDQLAAKVRQLLDETG